MNYNEFNITNEVNVKLKNNCVVGFEEYCNTVNEYSVKYSRVGIVHYNPTTGLVSPLINDSKIEEVVVSLSVQNSLITTKTQSFKVRVTNYNYATDFQISNVTFNYNDDSLMFESNPITLINGDELVLPIVLTPANYNVEPTITTLTPNLTITNGVIRSNGVISDNEQVLVSLQVGKEQYIHKIVNVNVVMPNNFTIELLDKNYLPISDVFTNFTDYILKVNSQKNFSLNELQKVLNTEFIDFYSLEETNNNNEFLIVFTKANNLYEKIALKHSQDSFIRVNEIVSNEVNVNVYNAIENFNFSVKFNETTLVETDNNVFNLHLINETYRQLSIEEGVFYYANVKVLTELNTKQNNYTFYVLTSNGYVAINNLFETECATIKLQENGSYLILPTNAGELTIKVISNDNVAYEEILTFNIIEEKVTNILNSLTSNNTITLYLNSSNINYSDNFLLSSFESFPKYAFSGNLTFTSSNSEILNVNQAQGIASAVASGVCELIVINENFSKTYFVEVKEYSGYILIEYNGNSNLNNTTLTITKTLLQEACVVQFATYFNNEQLNGKLLKLEFLDENYNVVTSSNIINFFGLNGSRFSFTTLNYGVQKIKYSITHLELEIAGYIIVNVNNPYSNITSVSFESLETEFSINLYFTNQFKNDLNILTDNENLPYLPEHLTVTSSSNNVLLDSVGNVTILYEQGYILQQEELVTITATALINNEFISVSYVIKLFYEINYTKITSLELNTSYVNLNFEEDNFNHLVNELIIINHGNEGVYNFNELTILSNDTNFLAEITNNQLVVTINKINSGTIKIGLLSNEDINCILTIVVTSYTTISCESDLYKLNNASEEFVITKNFNVSKLFVSINNFNGKLHGNGYTISGFDVQMFNKLELMAEISNFTINTGKITSVGIGGKVTSLALENYGIISNVLINAEYDINHTTTFTLGGAVYSNFGIISNVKLSINAKSNNTTNSSVGLFVYENFNTIENCEVLSTSVVTNFWLVSGFVYTNSLNANLNKDVYLNNCTTKFTFINNGSTYRFIPFIYRVQSGERVVTINCKAFVVYNGTGSTTNYGFVASSSNSSYINCELFINYNNYSPITLPFVSSGSGNFISNAGNNIFTNVPFYF